MADLGQRAVQTRRRKPALRSRAETRFSSELGKTTCGRWLVSASGGFLEPQLGLRPASRAVNLRPIPNALACYSLPAPSLPRLSPR